MNPIKKDNYRFAIFAALLFIAIFLITRVGMELPVWSLLFSIPLLLVTLIALLVMAASSSNRPLDAEEIKLVLRDYPDIKRWVESMLYKNELVTVGRVRGAIAENAFEQAEKQRGAEIKRLLDEQRKAVINASQTN